MPQDDAPLPVDDDDLEPLPVAEDEPESVPLSEADEAPLPLEEEAPLPVEGGEESHTSKIQAFGAHSAMAGTAHKELTRRLNITGTGATRVRIFNSKITVAAMEHMIEQINEWIDGDQIEIKHVAQVVGTLEGKKPEPNVIITVWY